MVGKPATIRFVIGLGMPTMVILALYLAIVWLVFFKFKVLQQPLRDRG